MLLATATGPQHNTSILTWKYSNFNNLPLLIGSTDADNRSETPSTMIF
jgi:hypothetical protein